MTAAIREAPDCAIELIKCFEGVMDGDPSTVNLDPYLDPIGIWTIGWGHAIADGSGKWLKGKDKKDKAFSLYPGGITLKQAEVLLRADLIDACRDVQRLVKVPLSDKQFGALVSFTFNLGGGALEKSTLLRKLNADDIAGAADEFLKWDKARDASGVLKALPGLTRRRKAERALFLGLNWR